MNKKVLSLLLAIVLIFGMAGCSATESEKATVPEPTAEAEAAPTDETPAETDPAAETAAAETVAEDDAEPRVFTDDCGREVSLPADITAIVPSGPLAQMVLVSLAPELLVGLASDWNDCAEGIIAEEYWALPCFGQLYGSADLNVEELAAAGPQLIIDIGEAKDSLVEDMENLEAQTQIPSVHIEATLATMADAYRTLGALLGREEKGEELALFCERVYDRTLAIMEQVGDEKVRALYILGEEGLNVLANGSYHAEVFDLLTENLAVVDNPSSKGTGNEVTLEQIALWNPDFLLFAPGSIYDTAADLDTWQELTAIRNGDYIEVPEGPYNWMGMPPGVQRYLALIWLTAELYPQYCDYDVETEVREYYALFYGCELTEEQYDALTAHAFREG